MRPIINFNIISSLYLIINEVQYFSQDQDPPLPSAKAAPAASTLFHTSDLLIFMRAPKGRENIFFFEKNMYTIPMNVLRKNNVENRILNMRFSPFEIGVDLTIK
jgi:hypothetical protein